MQSVNGVLDVTLTLAQGPVKIGDVIVEDAWTYNGSYPGPTLAVNPGDTMNIKLINQLPMATNFHFHGMHISPIGNSDNVLIVVEPGESNQFHVEIPADHPQGHYWYHPHKHGNAAIQLFRGASGMITIGRPDGGAPQLNNLTQLLMAVNAAQISETTNQPGIVPGKFLMKNPPQMDPALQTFTVNGQINPVLTMAPNEYQVVNMVNNSASAFYTPEFVDVTPGFTVANTTTAASSNGVDAKTATTINVASTAGFPSSGLIRVTTNGTNQTLYHYTGITPTSFTGLVSQGKSNGALITGGSVTLVVNFMWPVATDGNPFTVVGNVGDLSEPELISFRPGGRTSFIIGGFEAGHTYVFLNTGYRNPLPGNPPLGPEKGDGSHLWPPFNMFTVNVAGPPKPGGTPSFIPVFDPVTKAPSKPPLSPPNNYFRDLRDPSVVVAVKRTVVFGQGLSPEGMTIDTINGAQFPNSEVFQPRLGTVEEWTLVNPTDDDHPFHLHTNAAQIIGPGQGPAFEVVGPGQAGQRRGLPIWMDVINVPRFSTQVVRIEFVDYLGTMVYHCHRVDHEDEGMMALVEMLPAQSILVTGAGPGGTAQVNVYDGVSKALLRVFDAFGAFTGGVNVAVGDVNNDGVSDIICGAGPSGGPNVRVVDGKSIPGTGPLVDLYNLMVLDGKFPGGVNVAAGDINSDGFDDVIVGAGAGGGPQVMVYSGKNGQTLSNFFAFDAAFSGGVSVASGDVDGNGRFEIITGAGAGGGPTVAVFDHEAMMISSFFAFDSGFTGGVNVATGRVRGIGFDSIICGAGAGGGPTVTTFQAVSVHEAGAMHGLEFAMISSFDAFAPGFTGGVRVGSLNQTVGTNYLVGAGPTGGPQVSTFDGVTRAQLDSFFALDPNFTGGISVAAN